ncbi:Mini-ribonuclease 3 [Candidatus Galacturonibacter soehngenii]|uniref:Mini-ribonuclease 3 n=1 Tax=Candidatus Galacturonatibacter soehngenii TaxID=2307010 RepID=A0A7V7QNB8_9FIRM|nr:ribonuclease III domain-containing protein [Candidatus Galacturonibacter soehngenii]KAB1440497.1 ribonuclease III [Candidatus Galacturonibacter soehngenii]MBA4687745.1 ribonuclease III [Candidatus Galacturonibacter soehngenii]
MEKGIEELIPYLEKTFELPEVDIKTYSPLVLAYIGDGIYDVIIRTIVVSEGNSQPNKLHKKTSLFVKAAAQSAMIEAIKEDLTEEELKVYKRGRNAKSPTMAKNASMVDYRRATGFEALMGYLYLQGKLKRLIDLIKIGLEKSELNKK